MKFWFVTLPVALLADLLQALADICAVSVRQGGRLA